MIESVDRNSVVRIYYKAQDLESGLDVRYFLWDSDGTSLESDTTADAEIGTSGVYYLDHTTPNDDLYVFGYSEVNSNTNRTPVVIAVGLPDPQRVFYVDAEYTAGRSIAYEVYDTDGTTQLSGTLTELNNGFYYADVSSLLPETTYLFEADGVIADSFTIEALIHTASGGIIMGGSAVSAIVAYRDEMTGGIVLDGIADFIVIPAIFEYVMTGGIVMDGTAGAFVPGKESHIMSGGIFLSGSAEACFEPRFTLDVKETITSDVPNIIGLILQAQKKLQDLQTQNTPAGDAGSLSILEKKVFGETARQHLQNALKKLQELPTAGQKGMSGQVGDTIIRLSGQSTLYALRSKAATQIAKLGIIVPSTGSSGVVEEKTLRQQSSRVVGLRAKALSQITKLQNTTTSQGNGGILIAKGLFNSGAELVIAQRTKALENIIELQQIQTSVQSGNFFLIETDTQDVEKIKQDISDTLQIALDNVEQLNANVEPLRC